MFGRARFFAGSIITVHRWLRLISDRVLDGHWILSSLRSSEVYIRVLVLMLHVRYRAPERLEQLLDARLFCAFAL